MKKTTSLPLLCAFILLLFFITTTVGAQTDIKTQPPPAEQTPKEKPKAKPGTYEFFGADKKFVHAFTDDTLILIEEQRKDHEDISVALNFGVSVYIPARDVINNPAFKPLPEFSED